MTDITTPSILRTLEDREGNLWIGTREAGLFRLRTQTIKTLWNEASTEFNKIGAMLRDKSGEIWLGSGGLTTYADNRFVRLYGGSFATVITISATFIRFTKTATVRLLSARGTTWRVTRTANFKKTNCFRRFPRTFCGQLRATTRARCGSVTPAGYIGRTQTARLRITTPQKTGCPAQFDRGAR